MCSYIYAPFLPNFSLGVLNPHVLVCGFLLYWKEFHTAPYIYYICITAIIVTLFQKRGEFESQNACITNVREILPSYFMENKSRNHFPASSGQDIERYLLTIVQIWMTVSNATYINIYCYLGKCHVKEIFVKAFPLGFMYKRIILLLSGKKLWRVHFVREKCTR